MSQNKTRKCQYTECALPENNQKFGWQFVYLLIGLAYLMRDKADFTFFSIFLFLTPILIDLFYNDVNPKWINKIRYIYIVFNTSVILCCILGMFGIICDEGNGFSVINTAMICPGIVIGKDILLWIIIADLMVPILFWLGAPNKRTMETVQRVQDRERNLV